MITVKNILKNDTQEAARAAFLERFADFVRRTEGSSARAEEKGGADE